MLILFGVPMESLYLPVFNLLVSSTPQSLTFSLHLTASVLPLCLCILKFLTTGRRVDMQSERKAKLTKTSCKVNFRSATLQERNMHSFLNAYHLLPVLAASEQHTHTFVFISPWGPWIEFHSFLIIL